MRVLVTGVAGQLGHDVMNELAKRGYEGIGSHSFRKYFATSIYVNNNYDINLVRVLLQHSSTVTTQRYIGIQNKNIEDALQNHIKFFD